MIEVYQYDVLVKTIAYEWEGRQLIGVEIINEETSQTLIDATYHYNDKGYRVSKTVNAVTTNYLLDGDKVLQESRGNDKINYHYDVDGSLLGFTFNDEDYIYIKNLQGDIIAITDIEGNTLVRYTYDAYGNFDVEIDTGYTYLADANPYTYRGYRYDPEIGLYYLNSRYYDPVIGRFISSDGLLGEVGDIFSTNMYAFCLNNPIMMVDPNGFNAIIIVTFDRSDGRKGLPVVGHIMLAIQDAEGKWWLTQFSGKKKKFAKVTTIKYKDYKHYNYYSNSTYTNGIKSQFGVGDFIRIDLTGDFTACFELAMSYSRNQNFDKYNLLNNNCLDYVQTILQAYPGFSSEIFTYICNPDTVVPAKFARHLERLLLERMFSLGHIPPARTTAMPW